MKKLISFLLALILISGCACAELADLSFEELIETNRAIIKEIMSRPEWKEIKIPSGGWFVGEDIPAGSYSVAAQSHFCVMTVWKSDSQDIMKDLVGEYPIYEDEPFGKVILQDGWYVTFSQNVILAPPKGIEF